MNGLRSLQPGTGGMKSSGAASSTFMSSSSFSLAMASKTPSGSGSSFKSASTVARRQPTVTADAPPTRYTRPGPLGEAADPSHQPLDLFRIARRAHEGKSRSLRRRKTVQDEQADGWAGFDAGMGTSAGTQQFAMARGHGRGSEKSDPMTDVGDSGHQVPAAKLAQRAVARKVPRPQHTERHVLLQLPRHRPRRKHPRRLPVEQHLDHHPRLIRGVATTVSLITARKTPSSPDRPPSRSRGAQSVLPAANTVHLVLPPNSKLSQSDMQAIQAGHHQYEQHYENPFLNW